MTDTAPAKKPVPRADVWGYFFIIASFVILPIILLSMKTFGVQPVLRDALMAVWGIALGVEANVRSGRTKRCRGLMTAAAVGCLFVPVWHIIRLGL